MKRHGSTELPRCAVGALAIAGASAANAATVQITFNGSYISSTGGNHLVTDFGGDGDNEIRGFRSGNQAGVKVTGTTMAYAYGYGGVKVASVVGGGRRFNIGDGSVRGVSTLSVLFSDASIRGGAPTIGYLDLTASIVGSNKSVTVNRLIFDEDTGGALNGLNVNTTYQTYVTAPAGGGTSAVPEASTSLGLLALGAGGLLTRRRQKRAA